MTLPPNPKIDGYSNSLEAQGNDLKAMIIQFFEAQKEEMNKSFNELVSQWEVKIEKLEKIHKETQENIAKAKQIETQIEIKLAAYEEERNKKVDTILERQESKHKQMTEMMQGMKTELELIKKTQTEKTLELENLEKRSGTTKVSITNRIQEMEERISGAEDTLAEMDTSLKEKIKSEKFQSQNIQELKDAMKRQNLRIIGISEKEESRLQGPENIFKKIIEENFPNLKKEISINIQEAYRTPNRLDQKRNTSRHIIVKTLNIQNKERILKAAREKGQVTYEGRPIRITPDFSSETMKARRAWASIMETLRDHKCPARLLYPAKLSINIEGENKIFHDKAKFMQYLHSKPTLQKILEGKLQSNENNITQENRAHR